jgi:hypothetical protein
MEISLSMVTIPCIQNRLFNLKELHRIEDRLFYVSLYFKDSLLKQIHLMVHDDNITDPIDETKRKIIHDRLLNKIGINVSKIFLGEKSFLIMITKVI